MSTLPPPTFLAISAAATVLVALVALRLRSRAYATFRGVSLTVYTLIATALVPSTAPLAYGFYFLHATVYLHSLALVRPRMMPLAYRLLVSWPSAFFAAGTLLAWPWAVLVAFGFEPWAPWLPFAAAGIGLAQSLSTRREQVDLVVCDGPAGPELVRRRHESERSSRPLTLVQITDPHLGPFMSVQRLRRIADRAARHDPDLVLLTGDFLTMESQREPGWLADGLAPLAELKGRVFACFGNHDHEAPRTVMDALQQIGATLLIDDSAEVVTRAGPVQIVGLDYRFRGRRDHITQVCAAHPRTPGALRLVLLHDPGAFRLIPDGEADLVLSGHTHGGQVGLVSLGLPVTLLRLFAKIPDHGFWALGDNRLYVHRGTGHYGFPLRIGVPAEESLVRVHAATPA